MNGKSPWSWTIGRIAGIDVSVHVTFLILLVFVSQPLFLLAIFGCVLLHELGHALAARSFGIGTRGILLLPIGGVAQLERIPRDPWQELVITIAGPAVNFVLAGIFALLVLITGGLEGLGGLSLVGGNALESLLVVNLTLGIFNLIPAFPMDGGRILRALLAWRMDYVDATLIASAVGRVIAVILGLIGLFSPYFSLTLVLLAVFVYFAARAEATMALRERQARTGVPGSDDLQWVTELLRRRAESMRETTSRTAPERSNDTRPRRPSSNGHRRIRDVPFTVE